MRVAVITGASSGIGEATARLLASEGWLCVLVARRAERLQALAEEIDGEWEACDVGDRAAVETMAKRVLARHPQIDLLISNAGMPARGSYLDVDPALVVRVMQVNYLGSVWCARAFMPGLEAARGHIVNLVSVAGTVSFAPAGAYAASKHAQLAFSRSLAASLRGRNVKVHSVLPGFVETEGFPQRGVLGNRLLARLVIEPSAVANAILRAVERNKAEVVVPWFPYRFAGPLQALAPGLVARLVGLGDYGMGDHSRGAD